MRKTILLLFPLFALTIHTSCEPEYEQLHETIELKIDSNKDGHIVDFTPSLDLDGDFLWELGDGNTSNLKRLTHVYDSMGLYEIDLNISTIDRFYQATKVIIINGIEDVEENLYPTARAGNQLWMIDNLMTTTCADGTPLNSSYYQLGEDGIMRYNYLSIEQCDICPEGWRLPLPEDVLDLRNVGKTTNQLEELLNINEEGFGGFLGYMMFQDGTRLWHGDLGAYIERSVLAVTVDEEEDDYSVVRCIRKF
ncbi:MAG: PKD domain-containing protein [Bacteroidota bacterium]